MARRIATLVLSLLLVGSILPSAALAADAPLPSSMAAVGDSITTAASSGGTLGADYPANSWSTGTSSTVNSHYLRLVAAEAPIGTRAYNLAVSGAKMAGLDAQMVNAVTLAPDYLTVLIGGNDLCTDTVEQMTPVTDFEAQFIKAMDRLTSGSPDTHVYVVSIPDVYQLWQLFKNSWWARVVWSSADICQSLLANPTSTHPDDQARREEVRARNIAYNTVLASVCERYARCHHDGGAVFGTAFTRSDVSGDYFHPSVAGQAKLAAVSWDAGYTWVGDTTPVNQPPSASFTFSCTDLACSFTDTSTDTDGAIASHAWAFGDGATSTAQHPSHTYAGAGTYTVSLTVTDSAGATSSTSQSVTVSAPPTSTEISLSVEAYKVKGQKTADLTWSGATSTNVDVYRNGSVVVTTANDGAHTDRINTKGGGSYTYQVCEAGTTTCSNEVSVSY